MKISAVSFNTNYKKATNFKGYYENYVKTFDDYAYQKLGHGFSSRYNKEVIIGTYKTLLNSLKQFPENCKTLLFNQIFDDSKYLDSPYKLLKDLHEGIGSIACQALSVEAKKHHNCYETPHHNAYPLVSNENKKACLILENESLDPLAKGIRFLFGRPDEKNGFFRLKFVKDFHHPVTYILTDDENLFFCNVAENTSNRLRLQYKAHVFNDKFEHIKSYDF